MSTMTNPAVVRVLRLASSRHSLLCSQTRALSSSAAVSKAAAAKKKLSQESKNRGAFAVLKALNEVHEKDGVQVARLVSSLEALLPLAQWEEEHPEQLTLSSHEEEVHFEPQSHVSDPAFFSFPLYLNQKERLRLGITLTGKEVLQILQATRQGKRVALDTIDVLLKTAAWYFRKQPKVIRLDPLKPGQSLTVVGDLHGSLSDLEAVLGMTGEPSPNNLVIFNGDLADRGDHGVEVIAAVITLLLAYPDYVFINRGNHEDLALSVAYGLASEVQHKYGSSVFRQTLGPRLEAFFCSLPLATIVKNDALIVHAGPPPPGITLNDVEDHLTQSIQQHDDQLTMFSRTIRTGREGDRVEEMIESLLWSDPEIDETDGVQHLATSLDNLNWEPNVSRGAGFRFDSKAVQAVLQREGLSRLIRSHEPVHDGCVCYEVASSSHDSSNKRMEFFTVFSASRYPYKEGFNRGAVLTLQPNGKHHITRYAVEDDEPRVLSPDKMFSDISTTSLTISPPSSAVTGDASSSSEVDLPSLRRALREAVAPHRKDLMDTMKKSRFYYPAGKKILPFSEAVKIIVETLQLEEATFEKRGPQLALARALNNQCHDVPPDTIDLEECMTLLLKEMDEDHLEGDDAFHPEMTPHYPWLRAVFEMVDINHDGVISRAEWMEAVAKINSRLPEGSKPIKGEDTWHLLDYNGDGEVSSSEWDELAKALCR